MKTFILHPNGYSEVVYVGPYGVTYDVQDKTGIVVWTRSVMFGRDRAHRAGGQAFQEAARDQERRAALATS